LLYNLHTFVAFVAFYKKKFSREGLAWKISIGEIGNKIVLNKVTDILGKMHLGLYWLEKAHTRKTAVGKVHSAKSYLWATQSAPCKHEERNLNRAVCIIIIRWWLLKVNHLYRSHCRLLLTWLGVPCWCFSIWSWKIDFMAVHIEPATSDPYFPVRCLWATAPPISLEL